MDTTSKQAEPGVTQGSRIIHVRNLDLAVCLLSVGIPLRKDPPYTYYKNKDGFKQITFNFEDSDPDKQLNTLTLVQAFSEDMKWTEENPVHPFTFAMWAVKNLYSFKDHFKKDTPYVCFKAGGDTRMWVKEGSKKHKMCKLKGMTQI